MKFAREDKRYLEKRQAFSAEAGPRELWSVIDHWPLYCGVANLGRFMAIADFLRETLDVPGHVAEFGSWRGANLLLLAKLLRLYDPHGCKQVHCFDSFDGLTTIQAEDGAKAEEARETYRGNLEELMAMIDVQGLDDDVVIHKGLVQDTLPAFMAGDKGGMFSFVYCDTDLFDPTEVILTNVHERLAKGGLFVFDQWNYEQWPGETLAVRNFLDRHGDKYDMRHVRGARQPSLVLRKTGF